MEKENGFGRTLYEKMCAEQEQYKSWLTKQAPEEILSHAYEYSVREDMLFAVESTEFTEKQTRALLASPSPLPISTGYGRKGKALSWRKSYPP